jgi:hypothetical protein
MTQDSKIDSPKDDLRTMTLVKELADSLTPGIKFTIDLPSYLKDGKTPMLDTAVWVQKSSNPNDLQGDSIRYTFMRSLQRPHSCSMLRARTAGELK